MASYEEASKKIQAMARQASRELGARYVAIYEMRDGTEERFPLYTTEDVQHERAQAEREMHSRDTQVVDFRIIAK